jgi:hypothetical protein
MAAKQPPDNAKCSSATRRLLRPANRVIRTIGSDEVVHDAASIEGGVFTRSTNYRANNPATQSEVDGGASLGSP